jgi:hypothetical protein
VRNVYPQADVRAGAGTSWRVAHTGYALLGVVLLVALVASQVIVLHPRRSDGGNPLAEHDRAVLS